MHQDERKKITAPGVVIFSLAAILAAVIIAAATGALTALLVAKTPLPEGALKAGAVLGTGLGTIVGTVLLIRATGIKGIAGAGIMAAGVLAIKVLGNALLHLGGYFNMMGFAGILFVAVFALIGGAIGASGKRK